MTVFISIGTAEMKFFIFKQDKSRIHVAWNEAYIDLCGNELHGNIITDVINGDGRVFAYFTSDPVVKTVIQPFARLWFARMITGRDISFKWGCLDSIVESCIVRTDIVPEHGIELLQRRNGIYIQSVKPTFFQRPKMPFYFLYECSYKKCYTTDFFIRIFSEKY